MVGGHHRLNGHEFEQAPGAADGQGSLARYSPRGHRESGTTEQRNNNDQNRCVGILTLPQNLCVNLLGNRVLAEVRSLGWALIPHDRVFTKNGGKFGYRSM